MTKEEQLRKKKGKRNADRRVSNRPHHFGCGSVLSGARSPVGVPPRLFLEMSEHLRPASGQASWDAAATIISLGGRYPPLPVPVQWHPRPATYYRRHDAQSRPGEVCETARGHRTRSVIRIASGLRPALSEIRKSNYNGDQCQWKSDVDLPVIPAVVAGIHVFIPKTWMAGTSPAMTLWSHPRSAARLTGPLNRPPISFSAAAARASLQPPCFTFSKNFCSISARVSGSCAPPRI